MLWSVTVKQLKSIECSVADSDSQDETRVFSLDTVTPLPTTQLLFKIVGVVTEVIQENVLSTLYSVQDATGSVACFLYHKGDSAKQEIELNTYYRFVGKMRWLRQERGVPDSHVHLDLECAQKLTDMNELTFHFLESIHQHLLRKKAQANKMIIE